MSAILAAMHETSLVSAVKLTQETSIAQPQVPTEVAQTETNFNGGLPLASPVAAAAAPGMPPAAAGLPGLTPDAAACPTPPELMARQTAEGVAYKQALEQNEILKNHLQALHQYTTNLSIHTKAMTEKV